MRASLRDLLADARDRLGAVASFTCYNLETALGVVSAAEELRLGVVLLVSPGSLRQPEGTRLTAALASIAEQATVPTCVQLDHVTDIPHIRRGLEAGASAVMADGSALPWETNLAFAAEAVELAAAFHADVEAELGRVEGDEDVASEPRPGQLTDPEEAAIFVDRTGVRCLAVSIGNVHGRYSHPPRLDWERLQAIRGNVALPLSLHGTSGIPENDVRLAIKLGVAKFNVNTELRTAYLDATQGWLGQGVGDANVLGLNSAQMEAVRVTAAMRLRLCRPESTAMG